MSSDLIGFRYTIKNIKEETDTTQNENVVYLRKNHSKLCRLLPLIYYS